MTDDSDDIRVTINGERHGLPRGLTVRDLLERFSIDERHTAVERNRSLVPRASFATTPVEDGDAFEIVTLVGGG